MAAVLPDTPKEKLRAMRIFCAALVAGVAVFSLLIIFLKLTGEYEEPALKLKEHRNIFLAISIVVATVCFWLASFSYKKQVATVRGTLISTNEKLDLLRSALIKYLACCDAAALLSLIFLFLTGYYYLLAVTVVMIIAMLAKWPAKERVARDLELDWKQQQELE